MSLLDWFRNGGSFMYFVLISDIIAVVAIIVLVLLKNQNRPKRMLLAIIGIATLPLLIGAFGHWVGYVELMSVLPIADPNVKQDLYNESIAIARIPSIFGAASSVTLLVTGFLGLKQSYRIR